MRQITNNHSAPVLRMRQISAWLILTIMPAIAWSGNGSRNTQADILATGLPVAAYAVTFLQRDSQGAWEATKSLGLTTVGTLTLNALIDKKTPNGDANDAFPSGHSAIVFSSATFLQRRYGWRAGLPAYAAAGYVGWLRVKTDEHDWTDVLGGAALGILSSTLFTHRWSENVTLSSWVGPESAGLIVRARW